MVSEIPRSEGAARGLRYNKRMWIYSGLFVVRAVLSKFFCGAIALKLAHHWGGGDDPVTLSHVLFSSSQYQFSLTNSATTQTSTHGSEVKGNTRKKKTSSLVFSWAGLHQALGSFVLRSSSLVPAGRCGGRRAGLSSTIFRMLELRWIDSVDLESNVPKSDLQVTEEEHRVDYQVLPACMFSWAGRNDVQLERTTSIRLLSSE